jgi:hypothetical protein
VDVARTRRRVRNDEDRANLATANWRTTHSGSLAQSAFDRLVELADRLVVVALGRSARRAGCSIFRKISSASGPKRASETLNERSPCGRHPGRLGPVLSSNSPISDSIRDIHCAARAATIGLTSTVLKDV